MPEAIVAAVDVGSLANIGWWRCDGPVAGGGRSLDDLADAVARDLDARRAVALGFEAPLFVPVPASTAGLNRQRRGERGRPWCAGAGTGALALGIQQAAYVLRRVASCLTVAPRVSVEMSTLAETGSALVLWEAFVSGKAKYRMAAEPHIDDARVAVEELRRRLALGQPASDIDENDVLNLVAAAALTAGLARDVTLLTRPCTVVRAPDLHRDTTG